MQTLFILCSWLFATACADILNVEVLEQPEDLELVQFTEDSRVAASPAGAAASWLFGQRNKENAWGPFTPRAVVALALAEREQAYSLPGGEWELLAKQLNVLLSIEMGRHATHKIPLGVSRLSHYVNALYATCQDPRHFHGLDLVLLLREGTDRDVRLSGDAFSLPLAFVTLCVAGETTHADLTQLARMYQLSMNKTDAQALQLLAMACLTTQQFFPSARPIFTSYLREFASRLHKSLKHNTTDVYTKAMAMQALHSGEVVDVSSVPSLLSDQEPDGSFERSLLATYHAIPALLGTSLLSIRDVRCASPKQPADRLESFPQSGPSKSTVHLSLWIGEGAERDTHTVTVAIGANDTLLDVMRAAQERNDIFRFSYDATPTGARIYSLAGVPNDSEREVYWKLYRQKSGQNERLHEVAKGGVDRVYPSADDNIVFWFKRSAMQ